MRALLLFKNILFMQLPSRKRELRSLTWDDVILSGHNPRKHIFFKIEDIEIFNLQKNHVTFTAFSKDLLNARFPCSTASLTLKESQPQQDTSGSHEGLQGFPIKHVMVLGVG